MAASTNDDNFAEDQPPQNPETEKPTENNRNILTTVLSKNAQKKLAKQQKWEAKKSQKKAEAKEQKKKEMERKRKEWEERVVNLSEDERSSSSSSLFLDINPRSAYTMKIVV